MDLAAWLRRLGLQQYAEAFAEHDIDAETLVNLTSEDLQEIGVISVGHRRKLLEAIAHSAADTQTPPREVHDRAAEAERRQLTVMFADVVGSTPLSERLDPEVMRDIIRSYQTMVGREVARFDGSVAKFMGDGVLAYFGWPQAHEDDAERAVRSGLAIIGALRRMATPDGEPLEVRVGIATGLVVVGDLIGEGRFREEAVVGSTPNLAARLQGMAAGNTVVISDSTRRLLGERFALQDLGARVLRGFSEKAQVWRAIRPIEATSRFEANRGARLTPLVGREEELELLLRRWDAAKTGDGQVVLLVGEAGIGKSRMAHALHEHIAEQPHLQLLYQCSPYYTNSAFHPFIQQMEQAAGFERADTDEEKLGKLETLLAESLVERDHARSLLAALLSLPIEDRSPPTILSAHKQKQDTLKALLEHLEGLSKQHSILMVIEDVHWLDPTSHELLHLIVQRAPHLPVLVLATHRPEGSPAWADRTDVTVLTLDRLTYESGAAMVRALSGRKKLPREVLDQIIDKSDGVPLFVEELTSTVLASDLLEQEQDHSVPATRASLRAIPVSLKDSLMARLDRLAPAKQVAQTAAVIGREFSYRLLAEVSDLPDDDLQDALELLDRSDIVFRRSAPPDSSYLFKHALVQEAAYESLLLSRRQQLHELIAQAIERRFSDRVEVQPELLAHHYTEAGLAEPAVTYWQRAGERAVARSAHMEAIGHLRNGLAQLERIADDDARARFELALQSALGPPLIATKGYAANEVEQAYARAWELCREIGDARNLGSILYGLWAFHGTRAEIHKSRAFAEELASEAQRARDPALILDGHVAQAAISFFVGEFHSAREHGGRGMALYDPTRHRSHALQNPGVNCQIYNVMALWFLGYPDQALNRGRDMLDHARELAHPFSSAGVLTWLAKLHHCLNQPRLAQEYSDEAVAVARDHGYPSWLSVAWWIRGWAVAAQGRAQAGLIDVERGIAIRETEGAKLWRPYQLSLCAEVYQIAGQVDEAERLLTEALTTAETTGEGYWQAELHRLSGELYLERSRGDPVEAESCFDRALAVARGQQAKSLELRAAISLSSLRLRQGKTAEAQELLKPVYDWFKEGFSTTDLMEAKKLLKRLA